MRQDRRLARVMPSHQTAKTFKGAAHPWAPSGMMSEYSNAHGNICPYRKAQMMVAIHNAPAVAILSSPTLMMMLKRAH